AERSSPLPALFVLIDGYRLNEPRRLGPGEVDRQQSVTQVRTQDLHPLGQHERALKLARRDAAVDVLPGLVILLPPANEELILLNRDVELIAGETRNRKRNAQPLRLIGIAPEALDVVGRVAVSSLHDAIEHTLDFVESEEERA